MCEAWAKWHKASKGGWRRYDGAEAREALLGPAGQGFFYQSSSPNSSSVKLLSLRWAAAGAGADAVLHVISNAAGHGAKYQRACTHCRHPAPSD
jgi:hypothetical protein